MVGSMSAFDSGGAGDRPVLRAARHPLGRGDQATATPARTCFAAQSVNTGEWENAPGDFVKKNYPDAAAHAACSTSTPAPPPRTAAAPGQRDDQAGAGLRRRPGHRRRGVQLRAVRPAAEGQGRQGRLLDRRLPASVRLRAGDAAAVGFKPDLYLRDPTDYDPDFVEPGGDAVDGTVVFLNFVPFEEASTNKEMQLYLSWLQQVSPGADADLLRGLRLVRGPALRRAGARARRQAEPGRRWSTRSEGSTTGPPTACTPRSTSGAKRTADCWRFIQLNGGKWTPVGGTKYTCAGTDTG